MTLADTLLLALCVAAGALSLGIGRGTAPHRPSLPETLRGGLAFGAVGALAPVVGWALGLAAAAYLDTGDHWLAFVILSVVGGRRVANALSVTKPARDEAQRRAPWPPLAAILGMGAEVAAIGVTLAFIGADIARAALAIGAASLLMAVAGVLAGHRLHPHARWMAEGLGGLGLIVLGAKLLAEHSPMG